MAGRRGPVHQAGHRPAHPDQPLYREDQRGPADRRAGPGRHVRRRGPDPVRGPPGAGEYLVSGPGHPVDRGRGAGHGDRAGLPRGRRGARAAGRHGLYRERDGRAGYPVDAAGRAPDCRLDRGHGGRDRDTERRRDDGRADHGPAAMSDGLVPSVGSPPGQPTPVGVQPGTTPGIVLGRYVIVFGPAGGIFLYRGQPAFGTPPIAWGTLATTDPFKNPIQPGIFLAELASSGNALGGLLWNTVIGSEPLLALFPDSTLGFTGNSPFALGRVFNRGLASESVSLALGGGGASGISSPVMLELFGQSKDGTTVLPHAEFYFPLFVEGIDTNVYSAGHLTL